MLKKVTYTFILFIIALTVWIYIGSNDNAEIDDLGLLDHIIDVPNNQNGYSHISYTQTEAFKLFSDEDITYELKEHIYHDRWDEAYVQRTLSENENHINNIKSITNYKYFKFPTKYIDGVQVLPAYQNIIGMQRLVILKSMNKAKKGNLDVAISLTGLAVIIGQKIKIESNNWLISHMIGLVMQHESILWIYHLATDYKLDEPQLSKLLDVFKNIPSYKEDSFAEVFSGEYSFSRSLISYMLARSFSERWRNYQEHNILWDDDLFNFLEILLPRFYIHESSILNESAKLYSSLKKQSNNYCDQVALDAEEENTEFPWYSILKPNLVMDMWRMPMKSFADYFTRRCFSHAYVQGVKTIIALRKYELINGMPPDEIHALIPDYLQILPIDPFNGKTIKYSEKNRWVYSVGINFEDNGGSKDAYYIRRCDNNDKCANNLTFPITP